MFGLNEVPDLSSGGGARESCVIREPISIFSQIKNVKDEKKKEKLTQLLETLKKNLPEGFKIGAAVSAGDCFFDSVTQGLNELKGKGLITSDEGFNVQSLRRGCKEYAQRELNTSQNSWLNKLLDKESEKLPEYIPRIEFTAEDIKNTSSGSAVGILNLQNAIWGRPYIEGQILCNEYKVNLCYMEVQDDLIIENGKFYLRLEEDSKAKRGEEISDIILKNVIEADNGNTEQRTIHIVNYKQHFVPLLSDLKEDIEEAIKVSRKEIYGIPDNKNSHSLTEDTGSYDLEKMKNSKEAYGKKQEKDSNSKDKASEQMKSLKTVGDGNCFFHAVFGNNSSIGYKAEKAQEMRMEWHKFLSQFKSLSDPSMTEPLKESLKLVFSYLLSNVSEIHNVSPKMGDYIKETNRVIDKRIDESKEKVETLKNNIIEVFCKDEELRKQMYEKITQSIEARNERNKNSPQKQEVLLSIEDLREEKNRKELCDRIGDVTFPCASICGYVSTQAEYQDQYITNNDDILNSLFDNQEFYRLYLENIKSQDYFVFHNEIGILASLSGTEIEVYSDGQINSVIYTPDSGMINSNYVREYVLWGNKKREKIYHSGMHFSRTEVIPEQKESHSPDSSCGKQGSSINRSSSRDEMQKQLLRLEERTSTKSQNKGSSVSAKSSLDQSSKEFIQSTEEDNLQVRLENTVIDDIAKYLYEWTEDNNVIWGVEGPGRLPRELNKFKKNKGKTLIYIINKGGNHWVTLVAINKNGQGDIFFYADSFGEGIEKCLVTGFGKGDIDSNTQNKVSQGEVDCNGQNVKQNSDNDVIFVEETVPLINDNIRIPLDEFLEREGFSKNNIHSVSCKQQNDTYNCGVFALENAKAILNAVKDGNDDPTKVKESLKAVNKDIKYLNSLRENFASSLKKVSSINKQSSVTFSSSSEKGIEESIGQEPLHNYEELEEQTLRKLKEISSKYILTDKQKENELSAFIKMQDKDRGKFDKLWEGFVSLSPDEKKKAILRIFFFAEFWDSSVDTNENALRNVVWKEVGKLNAEDYIFRKSVDYLISFASTPSPSEPLISTGKRLHSNGLRRVLSRAQSFLSKDEMGNLIIRICIEIFKMRNTFNIGELFTSNKVKERLSTLKNFCESGRKDKIADLTLCDYQDYKILCPLLKERSQPSVKFIIDYLIKNLEWEESTSKDPLEDFIDDLYEEEHPRKDYSSNQKKEFLKQYNYYLIALAIDQVIQYNESPLEKVLSIAKDHFSEEEMNAMLERACKYIVDQRNKSVEGVAFDSEKAFRLLSDKLNSINRKKEEILKFLVDKLGKIQDFSENCQSSTLQQTLEEVVSYSPSRGKNTGNRNHESCSKNFFDELTMILDGGKTDKQDKIQSFISSRLSRYKGNCFYRLLLGEFLFENQDHAQISQKYLLLHLDSESIAFLLTAGQREKAKTTVLSIIDKSRGPVPNISSFAIDYRNLQIVNLEIDSRKSHLLDDIKKEDIEQGYKIKFIPMNEEVISLDLLRISYKRCRI